MSVHYRRISLKVHLSVAVCQDDKYIEEAALSVSVCRDSMCWDSASKQAVSLALCRCCRVGAMDDCMEEANWQCRCVGAVGAEVEKIGC